MAAQYANGAVYWLGQDGNIYLKAPGPSGWSVQNYGKPIGYGGGATNWNAGFDAAQGSAEATPISDPKAPFGNVNAPSNPNNTASTGPIYPDKSSDIAALQKGLGAVDTETSSGISAIDKALGTLTGQYDEETNKATGSYNDNSNQNQQNLQKNKETALVNAAQGRRGLFGTLASLGALNGSGITLANNAVQKGANDDLSGAQDTFSTNKTGLDNSIADYQLADKERRQNATSAADNAKQVAQNQGVKEKQQFYTNIANDYADMNDTGNRDKYLGLAGDLYGQIANTGVPASLPTYSAIGYNSPTLANYLTNGSTTVSTTGGSKGIPGLFAGGNPFATDKKKVAA